MGFMDKFKDTAEQAQDATKAAGGSVASMGGMGGAADDRGEDEQDRPAGVKHPAVLKGMRETGTRTRSRAGSSTSSRSRCAHRRRALHGDLQPAADRAATETTGEDRRRDRRQRRPRRSAVNAALGLGTDAGYPRTRMTRARA